MLAVFRSQCLEIAVMSIPVDPVPGDEVDRNQVQATIGRQEKARQAASHIVSHIGDILNPVHTHQ